MIQKLPGSYSYVPKWLVVKMQMRRVAKQAECQGVGRHTKEEVIEMGFKDLRALSNFLGIYLTVNLYFYIANIFFIEFLSTLGNKPFLMGDKPTEVDCAIFGQLMAFVWLMPNSPFEELLNG